MTSLHAKLPVEAFPAPATTALTGLTPPVPDVRGLDRDAAITALLRAGPIMVYVIGTLFIMVLAQMLRLVPAGGYIPFERDPGRHLILLFMPATSIGIGLAASILPTIFPQPHDIPMSLVVTEEGIREPG